MKNINFKKILSFSILLAIAILLIASLSVTFAANTTISNTTANGIIGAVNNASVNPGDTIFLSPGVYNKINNDTNITIYKNVTIQGIGSKDQVIIDGKGLTRIFTIANNFNVTFINITFTNGNATSDSGGAILNYGDMSVSDSTFINNTANTHGGAICNYGDMSVSDSTFINNTANVNGGAIWNNGDMSVSDSTFINNTANTGGAILNFRNMSVSDSTFINNTANAAGGAICNNVNMSVSDSTFINNTANVYGGAIYNSDNTNLNLSFSVFYNNAGNKIIYTLNDNCTLKDNFYFWVNPNLSNMAALLNNITNEVACIENFYYLNISNDTVLYAGETLNIKSLLAYNGTIVPSVNDLPDLNITLEYNGLLIKEYSYKDTVDIPVAINSLSPNDFIFYYGSDSIYEIILTTTLNSGNTSLTVYPVSGTVSDTIILEAKLTSRSGNPIAGATIEFFVNEVNVGSNITDINGIAKYHHVLQISDYEYLANYTGNSTYNSNQSATASLVVNKINTILTVVGPVAANVGETVQLIANLTENLGNPVVGATIQFFVNGVNVGSNITGID
ncbi:MAG: Ig-like domain repeat protein, partial [Methanobrevibacter sp.]|nr:Ig-like domain repeat protein [Methanobrevibacter sp.]